MTSFDIAWVFRTEEFRYRTSFFSGGADWRAYCRLLAESKSAKQAMREASGEPINGTLIPKLTDSDSSLRWPLGSCACFWSREYTDKS